jgi:hypothetical protein
MIMIGEDDYSFVAAVLRQLHPVHRPVFAARVYDLLQALPDPGPGDVDRAVRLALRDLWQPPPDRIPPRWGRGPPRRPHSGASDARVRVG